MRSVAIIAAALTVAGATLLSPAPLDARQPARTQWTASAGRATFTFRDVSRNIRPVDASPVAWEGSGPALGARFERLTRTTTHRVNVVWTRASSFSYVSPLQRVASFGRNEVSAFTSRYDYRRYFFRDLGIRGVDVGGAGEAQYAHASQQREYAAFLFRERSHTMAFGGAISARLTRWPRLSLEASWTNGLQISHQDDEFDAGGPPARTGSGGGWYDAWLATGQLRITRDVWLLAEYSVRSNVCYADHASNLERDRAWLAGVTYAR